MPNKTSKIETGVLLVTLGSAIITVFAIDPRISRVDLPKPVLIFFIAIGASATIIGIIATVSAMIPPYVIIIREKLFPNKSSRYICEPAAEHELNALYEFFTEYLGNDVSDLDKMKHWYSINPNLFWKIIEITTNKFKETRILVGYFDVIPLNKRASKLVEQEEITGSSITTRDIVRLYRGRRSKPHSVYIGGICALNDKRAQAATLSHLLNYIDAELRLGVRTFYTRPVSVAGLRLVTKHGFTMTNPTATQPINRIHKRVIANATMSVRSRSSDS